jgi:hypothetical protein
MCLIIPKQITVEEIIAGNSADMTDEQKAQYRYELDKQIFALLNKVDVEIIQLPDLWGDNSPWGRIAQAQYPTLTDIKVPDGAYYSTTLNGLQQILSIDWTNYIPYVSETFDCDAFANTLYIHLRQYYGINSVFPAWGDTDAGYHGFNCAVIKDGDEWIARLVEPQTDLIFIEQGTLGHYVPRCTANFLAVKRDGIIG